MMMNKTMMRTTKLTVNDQLKKAVFSPEIIMFKEDVHQNILQISVYIENLRSVIERLKDSEESNRNLFYQKFSGVESFEDLNAKEVITSATQLRDMIFKKIQKYKSYSWKLLLLIVASAVIVGIIEIIKSL